MRLKLTFPEQRRHGRRASLSQASIELYGPLLNFFVPLLVRVSEGTEIIKFLNSFFPRQDGFKRSQMISRVLVSDFFPLLII